MPGECWRGELPCPGAAAAPRAPELSCSSLEQILQLRTGLWGVWSCTGNSEGCERALLLHSLQEKCSHPGCPEMLLWFHDVKMICVGGKGNIKNG